MAKAGPAQGLPIFLCTPKPERVGGQYVVCERWHGGCGSHGAGVQEGQGQWQTRLLTVDASNQFDLGFILRQESTPAPRLLGMFCHLRALAAAHWVPYCPHHLPVQLDCRAQCMIMK